MSRLIWAILLMNVAFALPLAAQVGIGRISDGRPPKSNYAPEGRQEKNSAPAAVAGQNRPQAPSEQHRSAQPATVFGHTKPNTERPESGNARPSRPSDRDAPRPSYAPPTPQGAEAKGTPLSSGGTNRAKALKGPEPVVVNWMSIEQAMEKNKAEKKKVFVDVYTDWCGWCRHMDSTTFADPAVARYLNENYYPVKFNAEQDRDIVFKDKTYKFKKNGARGHHELAALWLNNRLSFPTVVFLDENLQAIQPISGYQDAAKMEAIIHYFGTDSHKRTPWEAYEKTFESGRQR